MVCGIVVGAAAGAALYTAANAGTSHWSWGGFARETIIGGALGAVAGIGRAAVAARGIVREAATAVGQKVYPHVTSRMAVAIAGRVWTRGGRAIRQSYGGCVGQIVGRINRAKDRVYRFPSVKPYSNKRIANFERRGHVVGNLHVKVRWKWWW